MKSRNKLHVFLVDDDALFLNALEIEFHLRADCTVTTFATGELCIQSLHLSPNVIILDYELDGIDKSAMNGLLTLDKIRETNPDIPVIMLSSQDKIEIAVQCMHHQAYDYVVKSETAFVRLQKIIMAIGRYKKMEYELNWFMERM
jgi:two-component system, OmpR family, response regulator